MQHFKNLPSPLAPCLLGLARLQAGCRGLPGGGTLGLPLKLVSELATGAIPSPCHRTPSTHYGMGRAGARGPLKCVIPVGGHPGTHRPLASCLSGHPIGSLGAELGSVGCATMLIRVPDVEKTLLFPRPRRDDFSNTRSWDGSHCVTLQTVNARGYRPAGVRSRQILPPGIPHSLGTHCLPHCCAANRILLPSPPSSTRARSNSFTA